MMEPISDGDKILDTLPPPSPTSSPPPPPASPPPTLLPTATMISTATTTPPTKPKKAARRSVSPSKEMHIENGDKENGERSPSPSPRKSDATKKVVTTAAKEKVIDGGTKTTDISPDDDNHQQRNGDITNGGDHTGSNGDIITTNGDGESFSLAYPGGVSKIVGEIEKFSSLGRKSNMINGTSNDDDYEDGIKLDDVKLDDVDHVKTPRKQQSSGSRLSAIEKSVLREMPVDVDIEDQDNSYSKNRRSDVRDQEQGGSGGEDSPRKAAGGVKRTPTMEFKKQCSKIVRIRTKVSEVSYI